MRDEKGQAGEGVGQAEGRSGGGGLAVSFRRPRGRQGPDCEAVLGPARPRS